MKAKLLNEEDGGAKGKLPAGTVIDHPDAYKLVLHGVAEPFDDECRKKAGLSPEKASAAVAFQAKAKKGLQEAVDPQTPSDV